MLLKEFLPCHSAVQRSFYGFYLRKDARHAKTAFPLSDSLSPLLRRARPKTPCAVLENARDETNLGAIFRSAAALGVDAVLLTPGSADPLSRRSARVSMGAVFRVPFARIGEMDEGGVALLKRLGFTACALALTDQSRSLEGFSCPHPALLLGNEGDGLKPGTVALCDVTLRIPMRRGVDSLNIAAAAAVAFWELGKEREAGS